MLENAPNKSASANGSKPSSTPCAPDCETPAPATPLIWGTWFSRCSDVDSSMRRKFTASTPFDDAGTIYGTMARGQHHARLVMAYNTVLPPICSQCRAHRYAGGSIWYAFVAEWDNMIHTGGSVFRNRPQLILPNHLCCFTSLAPLLLPNRAFSSLSSRRLMTSLPALLSQQVDA